MKNKPTPKRAEQQERRRETVGAWRHASTLIAALKTAGWGVLGENRYKGVSRVLDELGDVLDNYRRAVDKRGTIVLTVPELSDRCHLSARWTAACLAVLDELGIIQWTRGAVIDGRAVPSAFIINRRRLGELVAEARPGHDAVVRARRAETAARLSRIGARYLNPGRYRRRSEQVESEPSHSPYRGGVSTPHPPRSSARRPARARDEWLTLAESADAAVRTKNEPASPAGLDNRGVDLPGAGSREVIRAAIERGRRVIAGELPPSSVVVT